jgi:hypothetical protein
MGSSSSASSWRSTVVSPSKVMPLVFPAANSASSWGFVSVTVRSVLHPAVAGKWISAPLPSSMR